jgi:heterodisulfide reductase subunit A
LDEQLDFAALSAALQREAGVEHVEVIDRACDPEGFGPVRRALGEHDLNRVVFGACSAREMGWKTDAFAHETGMNPLWFASANLRDQCALVHLSDGKAAAAKARHLLQAAIAGVRRAAGIERHKTAITPRALVVGGGVAGMTAALSLADRGYPVILVERAAHLGGRLVDASFYTIAGNDPQRLVAELVEATTGHENIDVRTGVEVIGHRGRPGNFVTVIAGGEADEEMIHHGVVILATGGREAQTDEYLAGQHDAVLTQSALEKLIHQGDARLNGIHRVVMIQCVGSRERGGREYCSRVCCTHALKNARRLKELNPKIEITVLYRDVRAYGLYEHDYRQVRELGVLFTPYTVDEKPVVSAAGDRVAVSWRDRILQRPMQVEADLLVLATGVEPNDTGKLAQIFAVPRDDHGFYAEANAKAALVDFVGEGRYHCGLGSAPVHISEALVRARAAAARAATVLAQTEIESEKTAVTVSTRLCSGCGLCVEACPFGARALNPETAIAEVFYDVCHGCGICASVCPNGATQQQGFEKGQIMAVVNRLF